MKSLYSSLLYIGLLTISVNAAECKLILEPSDFQLDNQLRAPNESYTFSVVGNFFYIGYMQGYAKGALCGALTNYNADKHRACLKDADDFVEKDSVQLTGGRLTDVLAKTTAHGYKGSSKAPITKEHLCFLQNKYKTNTSASRSSLLPNLESTQEQIRKKYLEASNLVGRSNNFDEILNGVAQINNK